MRHCFHYALRWIVFLAIIAAILIFFDVVPQPYHHLIAVGYVALTGYAIIKNIRCAYATGADDGVEQYRQASRRNR